MKYLIQLFLVVCLFMISGCSTSDKVDFDPVSQDFYETARLVMTKLEKEIFTHLPDQESREEFIAEFWAKRDPEPETDENEFKEEFLRRIEYANQRFKEGIPGWKTDRGRIYIYFGPPEYVDERPMLNYPGVKGVIVWVYYNEVAFQFIDERGDGRYTLNPYSGVWGDFFGAIERAKFGFMTSQKEFRKEFMNFDLEYEETKQEIVISLPITSLEFKEEEGIFKVDFEFTFFVYDKKRINSDKFLEIRQFEKHEDEVLEMKEIIFTFPYELKPGNYYLDVIIVGKPDVGKTRKIFKVKV